MYDAMYEANGFDRFVQYLNKVCIDEIYADTLAFPRFTPPYPLASGRCWCWRGGGGSGEAGRAVTRFSFIAPRHCGLEEQRIKT